jgi:hypothetical protein
MRHRRHQSFRICELFLLHPNLIHAIRSGVITGRPLGGPMNAEIARHFDHMAAFFSLEDPKAHRRRFDTHIAADPREHLFGRFHRRIIPI